MQHRSGDGISFTFYSFIPSLLLLVYGCLSCISVTGDSTNEVTAYSGGGVRIKCKYEEEHKTNNKYFCKGESTPCADQIKTGPWAFQGRFSLHDNTEKKMFVVTITALRIEDTGQYCCGIESVGSDPFTVVQLTVSKGASPKTPQPKPSPKSSTPLYPHTTKGKIFPLLSYNAP
uniref:Ig-like domain-containing protein n=1 Tax=Electrophorus electricus TaxID=8005 RepID=A0AAY5F5N2_ELEEL